MLHASCVAIHPFHVSYIGSQVNDKEHHILASRLPRSRTTQPYKIELRLIPVGQQTWHVNSEHDFYRLAHCLLSALDAAHSNKIVHRDIRKENIVRVLDDWHLIDWELAGLEGPPVFWDGRALPDHVRDRCTPYTSLCDLWQLGQVLMGCYDSTLPDWCKQLAEALKDGKIEKAEHALALMPVQSAS